MTITTSNLVGLFVFLCLSLGSAHRVLKEHDAEIELTVQDLASEQDLQAELRRAGLKGMPASTIGPLSGCCNFGNCGQGGGYGCPQCPPNYGCGGNSGCQPPPCYTPPPCQWQGCQGPPPPCGCMSCMQNSDVQNESVTIANPLTVEAMPPTNQANQNLNSNGGLN